MRFLRVILCTTLLLPFAAYGGMNETRQYLSNYQNDGWVLMARYAIGDAVATPAIDRSSVFSFSKSILALVAAGGDPRTGAQGDLIRDFIDVHVRDGQIGSAEYLNDDFWGILALRAGGVPADHAVIRDARAFIERSQQKSGGWSWSPTYPVADTDDTAAAIMALLETGVSRSDASIQRALAYLRVAQNTDGGFSNVPPGASSVDSTAWVVAALSKAGENQSAATAYLRAQEKSDGSYGGVGTTAFVAIALSGKSFPVRSIALISPLTRPAEPHPTPLLKGEGAVKMQAPMKVAPIKKQVLVKKKAPAKKKVPPKKKVVKKVVKKIK